MTFLSRLDHGFWARANPVSMSWDSLKPPNNFLWKVSFCQVLTLSPSSDTRERQMEACKEASRSAEDRKHCQDFRRDPYSGPEEEGMTCSLYFRNYSDNQTLLTRNSKRYNVISNQKIWYYGSNYCTYWSPPLASTCCSIHWAAGRTASPHELFLGNMPLCHYRPGRHLLSASQCPDSSQATRTQRERKI